MKKFYDYQSQHPNFGIEYWTIVRDEDTEEFPQDSISPLGKVEADICIAAFPSNYPIASVRPADRGREIADTYHNYKDQYFVVFSDRTSTQNIISTDAMKLEVAFELIKKYVKVLFPVLAKLLVKKNFYLRETKS